MSRHAFTSRHSERPMCGPSPVRVRAQVQPVRRAVAAEDDDEDPDLSFLDELRDPEGPPHSLDDPEPAEAQRDPEHEAETTPDDEDDEELPPSRHAAARRARPRAARTRGTPR